MATIAAERGADAQAPAWPSADAFRLWLAERLTEELDPERVTAAAAAGLAKHLGAAWIDYVEVTAGGRGLRAFPGWPDDGQDGSHIYPFDPDSSAARRHRAGEPDIVHDVASGGIAPPTVPAAAAWVSVPLIRDGALTALFVVADAAPRAWTDEEVTLIGDSGASIQALLAGLRAAVPRRGAGEPQRHDAFARALAAAIREETDPARVLGTVLDTLRAHLHVSRMVWTEVEGPLANVVVRHRSSGTGHRPAPERLRLPDINTSYLDVLTRGQSIATTDAAAPGRLVSSGAREWLGGTSSRAGLDVPVVRRGALVAVLSAHHDWARPWTAAEAELVEDVADRCWAVLACVRAEAAVAESERVGAFVAGWTDALRQPANARAVPATTLDLLGRHLRADGLAYAEAGEASGSWTVLQRWGKATAALPLPFTEPMATAIAEQLRHIPLVVADCESHPLFDADSRAACRAHRVGALAVVPLVRGGQVRAAVSVHMATPRRWTDAEVRLIAEVVDRSWALLSHVRLEDRLTDSEALLAAFMEHAPVGMHLKDADGRYTRLNSEMAAAIGRPADEIIGRDADELFEPDMARRVATMEERARAGTPTAEEFVTGPRERYASLLSIAFPIRGSRPVRTGGFTLDLTDRKAAEAALQRSRDALYQSEKLSALGSLLAGVSHELNNPLSIVVAQAVMMERQAAGTEVAERAVKIRKAADRCARIVQTFLAMARQKTPERTAVNLNTVADAAIELANYGLRSDGVGITRAFTDSLPSISADSDQLHQVVTNLIVNAQQAMAQASGLRWLEVRTAIGAESRTVILEVTDSGPGIPPDMRRRIFEPFYTTKPQGEGTGVGLSFSQGVAEAHGGRLTLVPSAQGACFRLTLPIDERHPLPRTEPVERSEPQGLRRALIVDDEEEIAGSLADFLLIEGFECEVVVGGAAAQVRLAQGLFYDLVVSDLRMPDVDGPALHAWIAERRPDLAGRIAFTTGDTLGNAAARFLAEAKRPVLEKPFTPDSVRHFLAEVAPE